VSLLVLGFVAAMVRITVPYALAALGGTIAERAGVVQLCLEGFILTGAFAAVVGADLTSSGALGIAIGALSAGLVAIVYAIVVLVWSADQIVAGVAINLFADGLTRYLLKIRYDSASNSPRIEALARVGHHGDLLAVLLHPLVLGTLGAALAVNLLLRSTVFGLRVRAVGEHPEAAKTVDIDPRRVRFFAVLLGGLLAGTGGAYLAAEQGQFVAAMSAGRGYIALAAMIFGRWRPLPALLACLLFGATEALELRLQGGFLPGWLVQMLPYALTLLVLSGIGGRSAGARPPAALGKAL
jgi:simple sugar transport system permease protein